MSKADVTNARYAAIAAYTAAAEALRVAFIELHACDRVAGARFMSIDDQQYPIVKTFIDQGTHAPLFPRHAEAAPAWPSTASLGAAIAERFAELVDEVLPA